MTRRPLRARWRLALAVAVPLAWLVSATPAYAGGLTIGIDSPGTAQTLSGSSAVTVSGTVWPDFLADVNEVHVEVLRSGSLVDNGQAACPGCGTGAATAYTFQTSLPVNGLYTVRIGATGTGLATLVPVDGYADRDFAVAVPPAPPTGLTATVLDDRRVRLTWTGVSYPDIRGYAISRRAGGGGYQLIGYAFPGATSFTEPEPSAGGSMRYQVVSLRNGAVASNDANQWLRSSPAESSPVVVTPPPTSPAPVPGSTTLPPGGTAQPGDASNTDLNSFVSSAPAIPSIQTSPAPTLPDGTFSETLPFTATTDGGGGKVSGRSPGRPSVGSATGDLTVGNSAGSSTNRRALLVPVAAGSVLCVAALHLRWLNRRLAAFPVAAGDPGQGYDLPPADIDPTQFDVERLPVGVGK